MDTSVTTNDCNDLDLVRSGDLDAFGRIHDRHAALIFSVCRRHGPGGPYGSRTEAEDATQEVFIRAYRKLDAIDDCTRLAAWFCTIARFVVRERRRAMARRLKHEGEAMKSAIHAHGGADSISPSANPEREERFSALEAAMDQLPVRLSSNNLTYSGSGALDSVIKTMVAIETPDPEHAPNPDFEYGVAPPPPPPQSQEPTDHCPKLDGTGKVKKQGRTAAFPTSTTRCGRV